MKKLAFILSVLLLVPPCSSFALFKPIEGLEGIQIQRVAISPLNPSLFYAASRNSLYVSHDGGKNFNKVSVFKDEEVRHIFFDPYLADTLYIATTRQLYKIKDNLKRLFSVHEREVIYAAAKHKGKLFIGTNNGVYSAAAETLSWRKLNGLETVSVYFIESADNYLYLATDRGVYSVDSEYRLQRLFVMRARHEEGGDGLAARIIKVDIFDDNRLWLGTDKGIFFSLNKGQNWQKLYLSGIDNIFVNSLAQTNLEENTFYVGANQGFFIVNYEKNTTNQLFEGLYSSNIIWVAFSSQGKLYLATLKGLFEDDYFTPSHQNKEIALLLDKEPSITDIQQAALRYNEVHPEKIQRWRNALKVRALLPQVNLDYDKTINYDSGADRYYVGPRDWGVSFSWDVADLIWDTHQDDIDTRSRLNTQLRLDILDEINRVYFERLRLKHMIMTAALSKEEKFEKELRLRELTAILDGYTGGYFSKKSWELNEEE